MLNKCEAIVMLELWKNQTDAYIAEFQAEFTDNPYKSLAWSSNLFYKVALSYVSNILLGAIDRDPGKTIESLMEYAAKQMQNGARSPKQSTSQLSNLMDQATTAAWAEVVSIIGIGEL